MADTKISALPASTTPLAGTEVLPIVQSSTTRQVSVANLTAGRAISATELTLTTGNVVIGTSGQGIDFSATPGTGTSELLNDYEEGTWTPTVGGLSVGSGTYTKVGRSIFLECLITANSVSTNVIDGLPFSCESAGGYGSILIGRQVRCDVLDASGTPCVASISGTTIAFRTNTVDAADTSFTITTLASGSVRLGIAGVARVV